MQVACRAIELAAADWDRPDAPEVVALMRLFANDLHMQAECCARIELLCEGAGRLAGLLISHGALVAIVKALRLCVEIQVGAFYR